MFVTNYPFCIADLRPMIVFGYFAAVLIGISLGLIGGGGSILTVPVLVYLFKIDAVLATSYSLFIVGSTSLVGAYSNYRRGQVDLKAALLFGISSITTVFLTRKVLIPLIPAQLFSFGDFVVTKSLLTMVMFALLMVLAAISMIKGGSEAIDDTIPGQENHPWVRLMAYGVGIGLVTGFLGAGGGFLLIPSLVLLLKMPMKKAVGTSLLIIALNSLIGFTGDLGQSAIDWVFLLQMSAIAIVGIIAGSALAKKISGTKLKKGFGWFVLLMGIYILSKELLLK
jgi:uncharacterized protein